MRHVQTHTLWFQERVRSGDIELRKVNGPVNPADLSTKHLTSRDRITQLNELFNCKDRHGRSTIAPELRPAAINTIVNDNDPDINNQSPMHDPDVLPHLYEGAGIDAIFEKATAPAELDCAPTGRCICSRLECGICFPPRGSEVDPVVEKSEAWLAELHCTGGPARPRVQHSCHARLWQFTSPYYRVRRH